MSAIPDSFPTPKRNSMSFCSLLTDSNSASFSFIHISNLYCQYSFTHFTQKFIPLRRPQVCLSYPSNICGVSLPEAFRLSTSISACYSNNSRSRTGSLFSAVLSCNPYFFCRGCKTARSSSAPTYFRSGRCHDICLRRCSCSALLLFPALALLTAPCNSCRISLLLTCHSPS